MKAYGGAIADVPDEDTAFSNRDTMFEYVSSARWTDPDNVFHLNHNIPPSRRGTVDAIRALR